MLVAALLSAGCSDEDEDRSRSATYRDIGAVCLSPRAAGGSHVQVVLDDCESACAEVRASCEVVIRDGAIEITASAAAIVRDTSAPCPDECQPVVAACTLPPLSEGAHALAYGERSATVMLPIAEARSEALAGDSSNECNVTPLLE